MESSSSVYGLGLLVDDIIDFSNALKDLLSGDYSVKNLSMLVGSLSCIVTGKQIGRAHV